MQMNVGASVLMLSAVVCVFLLLSGGAHAQECRPRPPVYGVCALPIVTGEGKQSIARVAFNRLLGQCVRFTYRGSGGNANRFSSISECIISCGGTCPPHTPSPRCAGNPCDYSSCPAYPAAECVGNYCGGCNALYVLPNGRQLTAAECRPRGICDLPTIPGQCGTSETRYTYNRTLGQCVRFVYHGCLGNGNNFESFSDCQRSCRGTCPPGTPLPRCAGRPCDHYTCPAYPNAICEDNYCGGCFAFFSLPNGRQLLPADCAQ